MSGREGGGRYLNQKSVWYASYWNTFLLMLCLVE